MSDDMDDMLAPAARVAKDLRSRAHGEYPEGQVTTEVSFFDDETFSVIARHGKQHRVDGKVQTIHEKWYYSSERDETIRKTWTFEPGKSPYRAPVDVDEAEVDD